MQNDHGCSFKLQNIKFQGCVTDSQKDARECIEEVSGAKHQDMSSK